MIDFTLIGGSGFIGRHLLDFLQKNGSQIFIPEKRDHTVFEKNLGHLIYCAGLTADFQKRSYDTVQAHVCYLNEIIHRARYQSLTYLSSIRLYDSLIDNKNMPVTEETELILNPLNPRHLYDLSKALGESICLNTNNPNVRVIRLGTVYDIPLSADIFISQLVKKIYSVSNSQKFIELDSSPYYQRDYINVEDVVTLIMKIASSGKNRLYNVASGINTSNEDLVQKLVQITDTAITFKRKDIGLVPCIDVTRVSKEFDWNPKNILDDLEDIVKLYCENQKF